MRGYEIGLSALRTHSTTLNVIGNNIANAATPGFHRERVDLATRAPQLDGQHLIGTGVEIAGIRRVVDEATDAAILRNQSLLGASSADLSIAGDIESLFTPGDSSIHEYFSNFFNKLESVANSPEVPTVRGEFLASAENLLFQFDNIRSALQTQSGARLSELRDSVEQINSSIAEVAELNKEIRFAVLDRVFALLISPQVFSAFFIDGVIMLVDPLFQIDFRADDVEKAKGFAGGQLPGLSGIDHIVRHTGYFFGAGRIGPQRTKGVENRHLY